MVQITQEELPKIGGGSVARGTALGVSQFPTSPATILSSQRGEDIVKQDNISLTNIEKGFQPTQVDISTFTPEQQKAFESAAALAPKGSIQSFGGSPASTKMADEVNKAISGGGLTTAQREAAANLQASQDSVTTSTAQARAAFDSKDFTSFDEFTKRAEDARQRQEKQLSDFFTSISSLRQSRNALLTPTEREVQLRKNLLSIRGQADRFNLQTEQDKLAEFEGQTLGFAKGRAAAIDVKASFKRQEQALQEKNILLELGLETELRELEGKSVEQQIEDFQSDFELRSKIEDRLVEQEDRILDRAETLSDDARDTLDTFIDSFEGLDFTDLSPEAQSQIEQLAEQAGLDISLVQEALKASKMRSVFEQNLDIQRESRLSTTTPRGTESERRIEAVSGFSSAFVPGATLSDGTPIIQTDGFISPRAWKEAIKDAPNEGLDRKDFIEEFGFLIKITNKKGKTLKTSEITAKYGLTEKEIRLITG